MRRSAYLDLVQFQAPFYEWESLGEGVSPANESADREAFVQEYKDWINTGSPPSASKLQYQGDARAKHT
jgi:hypothetical protein